MDRRVLARRLERAERNLRLAQVQHDGSNVSRRRYEAARAELAVVERHAGYDLQKRPGPTLEAPGEAD